MKTALKILKSTLLLSAFFVLAASLNSAEAKIFKNSYMSFEIPDSWNCIQEGTEWLCSPLDKAQSRNAMIILSAKEAGPEDSFASYQTYLAQPRLLRNSSNVPQPSKVVHTKIRNINDQKWVEGLHLSSEIEGFYTLYLATVKQGLAVLVSLSAEKIAANNFNADFSKAVTSIRLTTSNELLSALKERKERLKQDPVGIPALSQLTGGEGQDSPKSGLGLSKEVMWGILAALFIVVLYLGISTFYPKKKRRRK